MNPRLLPVHRWTGVFFFALAVAAPPVLSARSLLEAGSATEWKFLTGTKAPAASWRKAGFDDSQWQSGKAPLGYGATRLTTKFDSSPGASNRPVTTWFRREIIAPPLAKGEGLAILLCADDAAVVHLNGREIARLNLPSGNIAATTTARRALTNRMEGHYSRVSVPAKAWRQGKPNILAVEVHQAAPGDDDCFFDLALKTVPPDEPRPKVPTAAQAAMNDYFQRHYVGPGTKIPDGYVDGGRHMQLDAEGRAKSGREIILVDRARDAELAKLLEYARSSEVQALDPLKRTQRLAESIDRLTTPPGGPRWTGPAVEELTDAFANKPLRIGDVLDQGNAGVCRHRSLLFKLMADEAGLPSALVRGNYNTGRPGQGAHAWNEVALPDGKRVLVDVMHNGGKPKFPEVTDPYVVKHYLKPDDKPWYSTNAPAATTKPAP